MHKLGINLTLVRGNSSLAKHHVRHCDRVLDVCAEDKKPKRVLKTPDGVVSSIDFCVSQHIPLNQVFELCHHFLCFRIGHSVRLQMLLELPRSRL